MWAPLGVAAAPAVLWLGGPWPSAQENLQPACPDVPEQHLRRACESSHAAGTPGRTLCCDCEPKMTECLQLGSKVKVSLTMSS